MFLKVLIGIVCGVVGASLGVTTGYLVWEHEKADQSIDIDNLHYEHSLHSSDE